MRKINSNRLRPIRDEVFEIIRKNIIQGVYQPGERLQEEKLAEELGVSRTPVREALRKLEVEKMAIHYPHKGTVVSDVCFDEAEELYEIRTMIEGFIARRAAKNATERDIKQLNTLLDLEEKATDPDVVYYNVEQYNNKIIDLANAPNLADLCKKVRATLGRMIMSGHLQPERRAIAQREHREIVQAIADHDGDRAEELTLAHLQNATNTHKFVEYKKICQETE